MVKYETHVAKSGFYQTSETFLHQNLALKSSEQVRNAAWFGEWTKRLTSPL